MRGPLVFVLVCISYAFTRNIPEILSKESEDCLGTDCLNSRLVEELAQKCPGINGMLLEGYLPANFQRPGKVHKFTRWDGSVAACVRHCCEHPSCNYAYMVNGACHRLTCGNDPEACSPRKLRRVHTEEIAMVLVRPPQKFRECREGNENVQCRPNEICGRGNGRWICKCPDHFTTDSDGQCTNPQAKTSALDTNKPPVANAGGDQTIYLPTDVVVFDGSLSTDDVGIKSWKWERSLESSAEGVVLENSDITPILMLAQLHPGRYVYRLTVTDEQGLTAQDEATVIIVKQDPPKKDLVRVVLDCSFSNADLAKLEQALPSLLPRTKFLLRPIQSEEITGNVMLVFYRSDASKKTGAQSQLLRDLTEVEEASPYRILSIAFGLDDDSPPVVIIMPCAWVWTLLGILVVVAVAGMIYAWYQFVKCRKNGRRGSLETKSRGKYTVPEDEKNPSTSNTTLNTLCG